VQGQVEGIFLFKEQGMQGVVVLIAVVQRAYISARAEGFFSRATQYHGLDLRVFDPGIELLLEAADHFKIDGIESAWAVQGQVANMVADLGQNGALQLRDIRCR